MNLSSIPHLSDEAVAAFADGMLASSSAAQRAQRHISECAECAVAVAEQQAAAMALRSAPLPMLPAGLLERLQAVPVTTPLTPSVLALAPDGSAVFPAFGTAAAARRVGHPAQRHDSQRHDSQRHEFHRPTLPAALPHVGLPHVGLPHVGLPHVGRRTQQLALVAVAAAMFTVGVAASASADTTTSGPSTARLVPAGSNPAQTVGFTARKP